MNDESEGIMTKTLAGIVRTGSWMGAGLLALFLAGCGGGAPSDADARRIAVIPKGTTHVFWRSIHAGAVKAERELTDAGFPVEVIWKGPLQEDDRTSQVSVVENFVSQQVSGIVLAPLDSRALVAPVERAARAGVPVVIIDSGLESDRIVSFAATDNFRGGELAGERLGELLEGEGDVLLLRYQVGSASTEQREAGFLEALSRFPDIRLLAADDYAGPTRETAFTKSQNLLNRHGSEVDGIFTPNESSTNGMLLALREIGRAGGEVKFVGFDGGDQNVGGLRAGDLQGLVVQDPFRMGYLGVRLMADHLRGQPVEVRVDTGVQLVTGENIDDPAVQAVLNPPIGDYLGR